MEMYDLDCLVAAPRIVFFVAAELRRSLLFFALQLGAGLDTVIGSFESFYFILCCDFLFIVYSFYE